MRIACSLGLLVLVGCKDPELQAAEQKQRAAFDFTNRGRVALADGNTDTAISLFKQASNTNPEDPNIYLLMAQAQKAAGNDGAAVLAIKQAEDLGMRNDPAVRKERAEIYKRMGQTKEAIATYVELASDNKLTDPEVLQLVRMQAHNGEIEAAFKTLEHVQSRKPDDLDAKVVEAEVLLLSGDEVLGAKLMDRLLTENPALIPARVLRARYFMQNGYSDIAQKDLELVPEAQSQQTEIVELKARVFNNLKQYDNAKKLLEPMVAANPRDPDLVALLAETELYLGQIDAAQAKVDQALALRPRFARALYVRGRTLEAQKDIRGATEQYTFALKSDPGFAPALSRLWPIYEKDDEKTEAMSALERLFYMNEASIEEKVALARFYADTGVNKDRGRKLIDEAVRVQPDNEEFKKLKERLGKSDSERKPQGPKIQIVRKHGH
jgi:tetratricopeptide (TPR) repeat protein